MFRVDKQPNLNADQKSNPSSYQQHSSFPSEPPPAFEESMNEDLPPSYEEAMNEPPSPTYVDAMSGSADSADSKSSLQYGMFEDSKINIDSKVADLVTARACQEFVDAQKKYHHEEKNKSQKDADKYIERFKRWALAENLINPEDKKVMEDPNDFAKLILKINSFDKFKEVILKEFSTLNLLNEPIDPSKSRETPLDLLRKSKTPFEFHLAYRDLLEWFFALPNKKGIEFGLTESPSRPGPILGWLLNFEGYSGMPRYPYALTEILHRACNNEIEASAKHHPEKYFEFVKRTIISDMLLFDRLRNTANIREQHAPDEYKKSLTYVKEAIEAIKKANNPEIVSVIYNNYLNFFTNAYEKCMRAGVTLRTHYNEFGALRFKDEFSNNMKKNIHQLSGISKLYHKESKQFRP